MPLGTRASGLNSVKRLKHKKIGGAWGVNLGEYLKSLSSMTRKVA